MAQPYEYLRLPFDWGDLSELNRFASDGWRVVAVVPNDQVDRDEGGNYRRDHWALLERAVRPDYK